MSTRREPNQYAVQNPLTQYPRPPFPDQPQLPPGIDQDMVPKPDHGEKSYQGFGRLAGRKALAGQVIGKGIRVNAVTPGPIWTVLQPSGGQPQEKIPTFGSQVPMKRPGQPAECSPLYVLLASQESSYITGEVFGVTGGNPLP